jgi:hypothetical protein
MPTVPVVLDRRARTAQCRQSSRQDARRGDAEDAKVSDEVWKEYKGYLISDQGRVIGKRGNLLSLVINKDGYPQFSLYFDGKKEAALVHRLVCCIFNGECPEGKDQVDHINRVRSDNRALNLRWVDSQENSDNGHHRKGFEHQRCAFTADDVNHIRASNETLAVLAKKYGVGTSTIHRVKKGVTYA